MKKLTRFVLLLLTIHCGHNIFAQTFTPPKNLPVKPVPQTPTKFYLPKPDLQIVSASLIAVEPQTEPNIIRIRLSVTYKNAGLANADRNFELELQGFHASSSGGGTSISSYQIAIDNNLQPLAAGQSRTEEWSFIKDRTKLSKGSNQCMITIDFSNRIAESDETNNKSSLFTIIIP
jgi:hypothetical protein